MSASAPTRDLRVLISGAGIGAMVHAPDGARNLSPQRRFEHDAFQAVGHMVFAAHVRRRLRPSGLRMTRLPVDWECGRPGNRHTFRSGLEPAVKWIAAALAPIRSACGFALRNEIETAFPDGYFTLHHLSQMTD